jgi:creatinine amidohydrolase/Fe(II)-dependent formamide hydrolase-like protein
MISHAGLWPRGLIALALALGCLLARSAEAQVYRLAELNIDQIRMLDRQRTVILLPGGVLEEHGPYLPSFTDGYVNERLTEDLAAAIAKRPGWAAVVFPMIPLGSDGANRAGGKYVFPGSYPIRSATLRAIFMDLATEFGEQGFRWLFVIHGHGSPNHNHSLDLAGDYFRDTYGGHMVNLTGLQPGPSPVDAVLAAEVSKAALAEDGFTLVRHAGLAETSRIMAMRPDLVPAAVANAPSVTGRDLADLRRIATGDNWTGYFGAPRYASAALGRRLLETENRELVALALRILDGLDERQIPRRAAVIAKLPNRAAITDANTKRDAAIEEQQRQWLAKSGQR